MVKFRLLALGIVLLLVACKAPQTVIVTQEVTREIEVTRIVVEKETTEVEPAATFTPYPTYTPYPTNTPLPAPTETSTAISTTGPTPTETPAPTSTPAPTKPPAPTNTPGPVRPTTTPAPVQAPTPAMTRIEDHDPGPPLTILVSANRVLPDSVYQVTGLVRNDGTETYEAVGVMATFFDDQDFRQGPLSARMPFLLLRPGEVCPFSVELAARNIEAFLLHPEGRATGRESAAVQIQNLNVIYDGTESIRITGRALNPNAFKIKSVAVVAVLIDAGGQITSLGSTYVLEEDIGPQAAVSFDLRVKRVPFNTYQIYAQAERDWE